MLSMHQLADELNRERLALAAARHHRAGQRAHRARPWRSLPPFAWITGTALAHIGRPRTTPLPDSSAVVQLDD
jgi:hypothetical protein